MKKQKKTIKEEIEEEIKGILLNMYFAGEEKPDVHLDINLEKLKSLIRQTLQRFIEETYKEAQEEIRKREKDLNGVSLPASMKFDIYYQKQTKWLKEN